MQHRETGKETLTAKKKANTFPLNKKEKKNKKLYMFSSLLPQTWFSHKTKKNSWPSTRKQAKKNEKKCAASNSFNSFLSSCYTPAACALQKDEIFRQTHKRKTSFRTYVPCPCRCQLWQTCRRETNNGSDRSFFLFVCVCVARTRVRECVHSLGTKSKAHFCASVLGGQSCGGQEKG